MPFCWNCGSALGSGARFCASCGKETGMNPGVTPTATPHRELSRPREGRQVAGVCKGLSLTYGWDVTITRIVVVLLAVVCFPIGEIAYVIAWILMPESPLQLTDGTTMPPVGN